MITQRISTAVLDAGSVVGIYMYIKNFVSGLDTIPYAVEKFSSLQDITKRIAIEAEDFGDEPPALKIVND
jgi:hypothetical protein